MQHFGGPCGRADATDESARRLDSASEHGIGARHGQAVVFRPIVATATAGACKAQSMAASHVVVNAPVVAAAGTTAEQRRAQREIARKQRRTLAEAARTLVDVRHFTAVYDRLTGGDPEPFPLSSLLICAARRPRLARMAERQSGHHATQARLERRDAGRAA